MNQEVSNLVIAVVSVLQAQRVVRKERRPRHDSCHLGIGWAGGRSDRGPLCLFGQAPCMSDRVYLANTSDGTHYALSGTKKRITNGVFSDYFITAAKIPKGMSVFLMERDEGLETKPIKTSYSVCWHSICDK